MQSFTYRKAIANDVCAIYAAMKSMVQEQKVEHRFTLTEEKLANALFSKIHSVAEVFCALDNNKIIGFVLFSDTNRNFDLFEKPGIYVHDIFVYPDFRRQGIGGQLMEIILEIGRKKNCCRIDWVQFKNNNVGDQFFKTIKGTQSVDYIDYKRIAI